MNSPEPKEILHIEGPQGKSIFYELKMWCMAPESVAELQTDIDEKLAHVRNLNDDRLLLSFQ